MYNSLQQYWGHVESWPSAQGLDVALEATEELYGMFLPHCETEISITPQKMSQAVRAMRNSSPGLDGWSVAELKALPVQAWQHLTAIMEKPTWNPNTSLLGAFRRVPLQKVSGFPRASDIRPLDIFSTLARAESSACTADILAWKKQTIHPSQHATHGGAYCAVTRLIMYSEYALRKQGPLWAISVDFSKLYNSISPVVAAKISVLMGLNPASAQRLIRPMVGAVGYWRLPQHATCPPFRLGRGIPQGLSASVLLGEIFLCALIWKAHWAGATIIGYVDDLHLLSTDRQVFIRTLQILDEFLEVFALQLNMGKSSLWGTDKQDLDRLSAHLGIPHASVLSSLGLTFPLTQDPLDSSADLDKLTPLFDKLRRIEHLPASAGVKRGAIAVGVLSTLDYGGPVSPKHVMPLRLAVKKAMGLAQGAPEVVFNLTGKGTIDPVLRWFITGLILHPG